MIEAELKVAGLEAWYDESHILHGVDFEVRPGEVVTLLGRNGAGKTTTLKSIMGIVTKRKGSARYGGRETVGLSSDRIAKLGTLHFFRAFHKARKIVRYRFCSDRAVHSF